MSAKAEIKVSVIVPSYNVSRYIGTCYAALEAQTLTQWEAICIDDGSKDDTLELWMQRAQEDSRITVIHKENGGLSAARNSGLAVARGKYVFFYDPDDYIEPDMLETMYGLAEGSDADFAICAYCTYGDGEKERRYCPQFFYGIAAQDSMKLTPWLMVNMIPFSCMNLFNRAFLERLGLVFVSNGVSEDVLFTMRVWTYASSVAACAKPLYHYVRHADSIIGSYSRTPLPVYRYLEHYFEIGRHFRYLSRIPGHNVAGQAAAAYVIMLRELGAAETYKRHDPVHDYAWVCRANRALRGRLWKYASKWRIGWYLMRIVLFKLRKKIFHRG